MRTIFQLLIIIISSSAISQTKGVSDPKHLRVEDFLIEDRFVVIKNKIISQYNYQNDFVDVTFTFLATKNQFEQSSLKQISTMVSFANNASMNNMKRKQTYVPDKIFCSFVEDPKMWMIHTYFTYENENNQIKQGLSISHFESDGTFKNIVIY